MIIVSAFALTVLAAVSVIVSWAAGVGVVETLAIVQGVATLVAIAVGSVFAFYKLEWFREFQPHLTISQEVSVRRISDEYVHIWVHVDMSNTSKVAVEIRDASFRIQHISPLTDREVATLHHDFLRKTSNVKYFPYPSLDEFDRTWNPEEFVIEPGETDTDRYEFIVGRKSTSVAVGCFFEDSSQDSDDEPPRGWGTVTVVDLD